MAENKRIRVSTDTTALQELRQQGEAVLNTFNQLEERFKGLATESLDLLHQQIDLIKERNDLLNGANLGIQSQPREEALEADDDRFKTPISRVNDSDSILEKIFERVSSIDLKLVDGGGEGGGKKLNLVGRKDDGDDEFGTGGSSILTSKFGKKIFGAASMAAIIGVVLTVLKKGVAVGRALYSDDVAQMTADSEYKRDIAKMESNWMNFFTLGFSRIQAQEKKKELSRVEENLPTTRSYAQLYNLSFDEAIGRQVQNYFDESSFWETIRVNKENVGASKEEKGFFSYLGDAMAAFSSHQTMNSAPTIQRAEEKEEQRRYMLPVELRSEITRTLGLSLTDYYKKISELAKAGVRASNTSDADLYQMLVGQTIRGYSDEMMRQVLAVTRFGATDTMTGAQVIQAMDTNLRQQGYDDQYIVSTLEEYVNSFSRFAENMLEKVGRIETDNMIQSMTSIQNSTGTEGKQLERIQQALTGQNVSQDDVTQALLLRTARQMNPNLSMFDLEATIEDMPNNINLQRQFLQTIQDMTGGGDMMKYTLQAIFPNLSKNDILAIVEGRQDLTSIFDHGTTQQQAYNPESAAEKLDENLDISPAGTANRQLIQGLRDIFGAKGEKFEEILNKIGEKRPVYIEETDCGVLADVVKSGVERANIHVVD